jgi:hypothetical protein
MKVRQKRDAMGRWKKAGVTSTDGLRRRRVGFVARLPHDMREQINRMLLDGMSYPKVVEELAQKGIVLTERCVSSWSRGGHQDWLKEQERLSQGERMMVSALKVLRDCQGTAIEEAGLKVAAAQIFQVLMDFDPKVLKKRLGRSAEGYAKLVHAMARLSDGGLRYERYRAEVMERKARIQALLEDAKRGGFTKEHLASIEKDLMLL